jgi:hypothetical protein
MSRILGIVGLVAVFFGMSLLLITAAGILIGVTNEHVVHPIHAWITDPGPLYVDDPRCCR